VKVGQEHLNLRAHRPGLAREIGRQYAKLDALAVLTDDDLRDYGELLASAPVRVLRIPNSLPELPGEPSSLSNPLVVAAGRLTPQKGFDRLIPAFARVAEQRPEWKLRIYGSGPSRGALQRLVFEHELYNNVALMGQAPELGPELSKGSVFALTSRIEGMPMVILEAMSKRLPVVAFDCPTGPRQLITHGHDGLLVADGDLDAFTAALLELIEDDERRRRMGAAALETARGYKLDAVGRQWSELLEELQETKRSAGGAIAYGSKNLSLDRV
jgi:glycosyltransferase involved in cell wall biosynthesis